MKSEEMLDLFVGAPIGVISMDSEGVVDVANPSAKRLLHPFLSRGDISPFFDVLSHWTGDLGARVRGFEAESGLVLESLVLVAETEDGPGSSVLLSIHKRAENSFVALVTSAPAVSQLQWQNRQLGAQLTSVEQSLRDYALYTVDCNGIIDHWSESAERVFHSSSKEMVGRSMAVLWPSDRRSDGHVRNLLDVAQMNGWCEEESFQVHRDGTPFWATTIVSSLGGTGVGCRYQVVTRDLSDRRRLEDLVKEGSGSSLDELTGVSTRRRFYDLTSTEIARSRRYGHPLTILLIDPDNFRETNERFGTSFGDECLRAIAWVSQQECRTTDMVGRVGGEEFALLLPSTELEGGLVLAERIRERMQRHVFAGEHNGIRCTVSVGVAELRDDGPSVDSLLALAETAVSRAKLAGRNLVVGYDD